MTDRDRRISDQLVRLVQIVFGLVLAQSFVLHRDIVVDPTAAKNLVPALALATVYITTVLSWIDWHVNHGGPTLQLQSAKSLPGD